MSPPDFETVETGTFAAFSKQRLTIYRLTETCHDLLKVVDQLMPGIGHVVADIGFINDTLIDARAMLKELEDETHDAQSKSSKPDKPALPDSGDEPRQPDRSDEGTD